MPAGRPLTVVSYLEEWLTVTLPAEVLAGRLKRSTLASYTDQTRRHIMPPLGATPLAELGPRQLRAWLSAKLTETSARGRPLSARTVAYLHGILRPPSHKPSAMSCSAGTRRPWSGPHDTEVRRWCR